MTRCLNAATAGLLGVWGVMTHAPARAAEIVVLTNLGVVSAVRDLAPAFERASGHKVIVGFELGSAMMQKINSNAPADLVTQTPDVIDSLIKQGKVVGERGDWRRRKSRSAQARHRQRRRLQALDARRQIDRLFAR